MNVSEATVSKAAVKGSCEHYLKEVVPVLKKEFGFGSIMEVPVLKKIVVNMGLGETKNNKAVLTDGLKALTILAGQKPVSTRAKKAIAGFKIREGMDIGAMVTLRNVRMYDFLQRLIHIALPRVKDFHGIKRKGFDRRGNFTLGIKDSSIFPELSSATSVTTGGLSITFVTSAANDKHSLRLLELMGIPFMADDKK